MRTLTKLIAGAAVLLAAAGCTSGARSASSALQGSGGPDEAASTDAQFGDLESLASQSTNKHLLAEEGGYKFYSLVPVDSNEGRLCVVVQQPDMSGESKGCGNSIPYVGVGYGDSGDLFEAKLVFAGYNAGKDLAEGWGYLHPNLLVRGLDDVKSDS